MRYYLLIVGLGMIAFGLRLMYHRIAFLLRSRKAYGKLDNWKEIPNLKSTEIYYYAEVVFEASDGTEHRVTSDTGDGYRRYVKPDLKTGRTIAVRYDPGNPDVAHIDTLFNLWSPSCAFLLMGGGAIFAFFHARN